MQTTVPIIIDTVVALYYIFIFSIPSVIYKCYPWDDIKTWSSFSDAKFKQLVAPYR